MEYQDKLHILETVLNKYGLSIYNEEVDQFFNGIRKLDPTLTHYEDFGVKKEYSFSSNIKPQQIELLPSDFENASYGRFSTLLEWFM